MHSPAPRALALRTTSAIYPGNAEHISAVRADLRALLADCPMADDVILCASELAANAALHSDSRQPGGTFTVRTMISPGHYVRIDVEDQGGLWEPAVSNPDRHHGLDILCALARDWDIEDDQVNRTVWAVFDWASVVTVSRHSQGSRRWTVVVDGGQLRKLRRQHGLARKELAGRAGISLHTLSRLERQQNASCRTRTVARLAAVLGEEPSSIAPGIGEHTH